MTAKLLHVYLIAVNFILPAVTRVIFSTFTCVDLDSGES